ncbi:hypothetical protein Sjap_000860 [Stephania japonica]|uniref:Methenyltetrahydrofolate cyclohydrolase n=1 Tax=Stephania japonica TaxID=461633 RepID=A0AAP0KJV1_9MAGN
MMRRGLLAFWRRNGAPSHWLQHSSLAPPQQGLPRLTEAPSIIGPNLPEIWAPPIITPPHHNASIEQTATIIDGRLIAEDVKSGLADEVRRMKNAIQKVPGLAVVLVGQRRDSQTYVRNKIKACEDVGIMSLVEEMPADCSQDEVLNAVLKFNTNPSIHGILVQLPLPQQHMDEEKILNTVSLEKDVDGFHPMNMGNLAMSGRKPLFIPCTPKACIELLHRTGTEIMGRNVVVIGRSNIAGLPTSLLLQENSVAVLQLIISCGIFLIRQRHHATVTIVHAFTKNPEEITREADIVISAAGVANLVRGSWLKPGAVVIDVGTNPVEDPDSEHGYCLKGDVCFEEAVRVASAITPVPGGVGPMTVAMLLANTVDSAKTAYECS